MENNLTLLDATLPKARPIQPIKPKMYANKIVLVQLVVVACLAGLVLSASVEQRSETEEPRDEASCEACKAKIQRFKENIPMIEKQLKALCQRFGTEAKVEECEQAVEKDIARIERGTPEQICADLGLCKKSNFLLNLLDL